MKKLLILLVIVSFYSCESDDDPDYHLPPLTEILPGVYELDRASINDGTTLGSNSDVFYDGTQGCPDIIEITPDSFIWDVPDTPCTDYETTIGVYAITETSFQFVSYYQYGSISGWLSDNFFYNSIFNDNIDGNNYVETLWFFDSSRLGVTFWYENDYHISYRFEKQ